MSLRADMVGVAIRASKETDSHGLRTVKDAGPYILSNNTFAGRTKNP